MAFHVLDRPLDGVVVFQSDIHKDERGHLLEAYRADAWRDMGVPDTFVQENQSFSRKGVVRGLHFQWEPMMGKVMRVTRGRAFLVGADIRHGSPTLGRWFGLEASEEDAIQVWAPPGFARGFCALEEGTTVLYKCTGTWNAKGESGIRWNDPAIGIRWPIASPTLSGKDAVAQSFEEWLRRPESQRFRF